MKEKGNETYNSSLKYVSEQKIYDASSKRPHFLRRERQLLLL